MTRRLSLLVLAGFALRLTASPIAQIQNAGPVTIDTGQLTGALAGANHDISV